MNEDRERRIYRVVVISIVIVGALGFLWFMTQSDQGLGEQGIFQFFSDPEPGSTSVPGSLLLK
ncbi:MAG: hypothetical protein ACTHZ9_07860 [Leucobacter sp.]